MIKTILICCLILFVYDRYYRDRGDNNMTTYESSQISTTQEQNTSNEVDNKEKKDVNYNEVFDNLKEKKEELDSTYKKYKDIKSKIEEKIKEFINVFRKDRD